mmetsp:Transcript_35164/g.39996  ORF Transcript_35164/g.39996 Transcript_35164/m.39996 type:complete len:92 (-) Transcript_35164:306-581(-)
MQGWSVQYIIFRSMFHKPDTIQYNVYVSIEGGGGSSNISRPRGRGDGGGGGLEDTVVVMVAVAVIGLLHSSSHSLSHNTISLSFLLPSIPS